MTLIASSFPSLTTLFAIGNQWSRISSPPDVFSRQLTVLNLEFNEFRTLSSLQPLVTLPLKTLYLKGNKISAVSAPDLPDQSLVPVFLPLLHYVDLSYNQISVWSVVDALPTIFPGLTSLRLSHNPVYEQPDSLAPSTNSTATTEEAHMFTVARLAKLKMLNFAVVGDQDRCNAEMFYLSRIAKQLATVPPEREDEIIKLHPRYYELCEAYGTPDVVRKTAISESLLEGRLVKVKFRFCGSQRSMTGKSSSGTRKGSPGRTVTIQIPKSCDVYTVQGIAGRVFGVPPLKTRLVWETGEWDPVAGFEDTEGDSSGDEEAMEIVVDQAIDKSTVDGVDTEGGEYKIKGKKIGKWMKREVELKEGPRQFGFVVDGLDVKIRVEMKE